MKRLLLIIAALFISFNTFAQEIETTVDGIIYFLENNEAYVVGNDEDFDPVTLTIPEAIEYGNTTYTVVKIDANAFVCSNLTTVVIPSGVREIGDKAFYGSTNLVKVECLSTTPPTMSQSTSTRYRVFYNYSDLKIYVPEGCVNTYKSSWYTYENNIQGEDPIVFKGGSGSSDWNVTGNWSGLPKGGISALADKDVIIRAAATIANEIEVNSYKIEGNGSITIEDGGQFIVHAKSEGSVTMEKTITPYAADAENYLLRGWYSVSSPFEGSFTLSENNFLKGTYELFRYNEATSMWENKKAHSDFTTLEPGKGYLYANKEGQTLSITGKPNINDQTISLTAQGTISELQGFNLIGNPFTHNIYKNTDNTIVSEGYFTLTNEGAWVGKLDSEPIKPMQGFLVKTNKKYNITIAHSHKSPASKRSNKGAICINVANNEYSDVAYISFNEGLGLDKIEHRNNEIPMVYVPVDGTDYAIAIMDENAEEYPVNFEAKKMGEYTIGISAEGRKYSKLTLIDKQDNNKEIDMLKGNYTFLATTTDDPARFILKVSLNNNQEAAFYTENNSIIIENIKGKGSVQVYDVMGRPVIKYNTNDSNCQLSTSSLANGVYIIQLIDENGTQVQKVIVNN
ncbi:MAG: T9SS type A sorting domain-containing protein [Bacteroidales bacterium]|nr:T9SS type A sorting domain-containing protein [Bacteroidales bacterium]